MASSSSVPVPSTPPRTVATSQTPKSASQSNRRATEVERARVLQRDKDNFSAFHARSKKRITNGPFRLRPSTKISTKTIDTDTIGRVNKANQKMSQFLYNLANEPSVGLYHVNDHVRRAVPRLVAARKDIDFQKEELEKSSCDIDDILSTVKSIGSLTSFRTMQSLLLKSIQLSSPRPPPPSPSSVNRNLGASQPGHTSMKPASSPYGDDGHSTATSSSAGLPTPEFINPRQPPAGLVSLAPRVESSSDFSDVGMLEQDVSFSPVPFAGALSPSESHLHTSLEHDPSVSSVSIPSQESPNEAFVDTSAHEAVDQSTGLEPKLTQEEMILGTRAHSMKKKKRTGSGGNESLVPKAF